jgi:hypothetical protein
VHPSTVAGIPQSDSLLSVSQFLSWVTLESYFMEVQTFPPFLKMDGTLVPTPSITSMKIKRCFEYKVISLVPKFMFNLFLLF